MLSKLEDLARRAKARMPAAARGVVQRLEDAYHAQRGKPASAQSATEAPPPEPAAPPEPKEINWELRSQADLVDHIEQHYHAGLRRDLPALADAARKIEKEHKSHASVPSGLSDLLAEFFSTLDSHMMKEEHMLFPPLRTGARGGELDMPMRMMEREHDDHAKELSKIRELTREFVAPADATSEWTTLYEGLAALETALRQHIYLEDNILFVRGTGGGY